VRADQTVVLQTKDSRAAYPEPLRRVPFYDANRGKRLVFLTNHFDVPAPMVAELYRQRWQVELFFKWVKQRLRIKAFFGTSPNAVKTQIWTAISLYLLIAIAKKKLDLPGSLHTILHLLEVNAFEKKSLKQLVIDALRQDDGAQDSKQLNLFDN